MRRDFFLDPAKRLSEQERALMTSMLRCLVGDVAAAVRAALPSGRVSATDESDATLVDRLTVAGLLDEPDLMALLLRRADEERIATAARARSGRREARVLQGLVSHDYGTLAAAAMALILGRGRRRDRFGQCLIAFDDLSPASAEALIYSVAAGLRQEAAGVLGGAGADAELAGAAEQVLDSRADERGIEALTAGLVHLLDESGALTDDLLLAAMNEGELSFIAEAFANRAGIRGGSALDELLSGDHRHVMALLRAAGVSRTVAAGLLAGIGDLLGIADASAAIDAFDHMPESEIEAERSWLLTSPAYRAALDRLGQDRG